MPTAQPSANHTAATALPEATDHTLVPTPANAPSAHATHRFTLYAYRGRVYASNVRDKLIDLGTVSQQDDGWAYALDGDVCPGESGFASAEEALAAVGRCVTFLYLDGQFTAQRDLSDVNRPDLPDAPQVRVTLDPKGLADPAVGDEA